MGIHGVNFQLRNMVHLVRWFVNFQRGDVSLSLKLRGTRGFFIDRKGQQRPTNSLAPQPVIVAIGPVSLLHRLDAHPGMHLVLSLHWHLGLRGLPGPGCESGKHGAMVCYGHYSSDPGYKQKRGIRLGWLGEAAREWLVTRFFLVQGFGSGLGPPNKKPGCIGMYWRHPS